MNRRNFLLGMPALAACADRRRRLNVLNFSDYIAPDTIPNFEAETGTRVRYTVADGQVSVDIAQVGCQIF